MGIQEVFTNNLYFSITLFSFLLLSIACYSTSKYSVNLGARFLFLGLLVEFAASYLEVEILNMYSKGDSITVMMALELSLLLVSMIFLGIFASKIIIGERVSYSIFFIAGLVGLGSIIAFVFLIPDGLMVINMRQIFPLTAFAYISVSFFSQIHKKESIGYILGGAVSGVISVYFLAKLIKPIEVSELNLWYLPSCYYVVMGMSLLMVKTSVILQKFARTKEEISKYNNRIEDIIKSSPFPIIISRLTDDKILLANNNAVKLFGINPTEIERYRLKDFFADTDNRRLLNERLEHEKEVQDFEILVKTPMSDSPFWLLTSANVIDYNYDIVLYSAFQDITSRKNREVLLKHQAVRDPLTSLYNRRYFEEEVSKQILASKSGNIPYSVLMLDADHFKRVNDTYGHKVGDKVLIELASTTEKALRDNDIVARYGGEEFVVFLPNIDCQKAVTVAERLRETISNLIVFTDDNQQVKFTISIGVSSDQISDNVDMLIKTADEALYKAKQNGRNRVEAFMPDDLHGFNAQDKKDDSQNHHPIFDKEEISEVSLLDDVSSSYIQDENIEIEETKTQSSIRLDNEEL